MSIRKYKIVRNCTSLPIQRGNTRYISIEQNAGFHNSIYRGQYLGNKVTEEQYVAISSGTFDDLFIGDYWEIGGITWRIAAFDYYLGTGFEECTTHHAVIVPDEGVYNYYMNNENTTDGCYVNSEMYMEGLDEAKNIIKKFFGKEHILTHWQFFSSEVEENFTIYGKWVESTVDLMNEINVYGYRLSSKEKYTVDKTQFPLFRLNPIMINPHRRWYWLRDVASDLNFALVNGHGLADADSASHVYGVRPCFCLKGDLPKNDIY